MLREGFWAGAWNTDPASGLGSMSKSDSAAHQSAATTRRIDTGRLTRALTDGMAVRDHGEASEVALRAHRLSDEARWTTAAIYCAGCLTECGTIETATLGAVELVLAGRLVTRGDAAGQTHRLVFQANEGHEALLDYSGADDGDTL